MASGWVTQQMFFCQSDDSRIRLICFVLYLGGEIRDRTMVDRPSTYQLDDLHPRKEGYALRHPTNVLSNERITSGVSESADFLSAKRLARTHMTCSTVYLDNGRHE
ncbi:hypothetical protein PAXRUDRAFT_205135 [Paxillus rubicundulus Ve08.2h10]|uniref:Unplaced genomic scaffold scaffold_105, whole genome shotgun sequence n=1 Tax=Paxillus rubicundulus Ve08.2h10 TaxID=930991 RepID=A0A0D0EBH7_9AGAM|nr:hypothetical protein PAXRUDRAFT_205135 [Paxillus rubicundulus Ve08.2h10]